MAGYMPPSHVPLEPKWRHWPTYVYDKNYGYGMNYYQPMLDYIDCNEERRERTRLALDRLEGDRKRCDLPDLPWSDGRKFWEANKLHLYDKVDLIKRAIDAEDQARDHLSRFKIAKRTDFSLAKTVHASRVTHDVLNLSSPLWLNERRTKKKEPREVLLKALRDIDMQALKDIQSFREAQDAFDHGKSLRGKSARAIEIQLRTEALKNLTKSQELADIRKYQREASHGFWEEREYSKLMDERAKLIFDEAKFTEPLDTLSKELRGYEQKSSNYFLDKRYRNTRKREFPYRERDPVVDYKYFNRFWYMNR